ncbi:MAG: SUMF1/EgtB/PvdO family nonheme iron enzyme [Verrucomicrobia bacterium]|nr:SUMF1/EgtB/PvdO family nonheme iron enzyme [Verrucomicrobiota bacterium]
MSQDPPPNVVRFKRYEVACDARGRPIQLAHGGMGVTYKAHDPKLDCTVVLKIVGELLQSDEASLARFRREARKLAQLRDHPHIATLFDFDEQDGKDFYVMEFIDGEDLASRVRREGPLSIRDALVVVKQVSSALTAMWARSLVHRDIKPANIMALREAKHGLFVKLIDFGLAKDIGNSEQTQVTHTGEHGGMSVFYASPEQIKAQPLDIRSDLYSLGITLWFLLTGKTPFSGTSMWQVTNKQLHDAPPLDELPSRTPPAVRDLLERLLAKRPEDRPSEPTKVEAEAAKILEMLPAGPGYALGEAPTVSGGALPGAEHFRATEAMPDPHATVPLASEADSTLPMPGSEPAPAGEGSPADSTALLGAATAMRSMAGETTIPMNVRAARNFEPPLFATSTMTRRLEHGPKYRWRPMLLGGAGIFLLALLAAWAFFFRGRPAPAAAAAPAGPTVVVVTATPSPVPAPTVTPAPTPTATAAIGAPPVTPPPPASTAPVAPTPPPTEATISATPAAVSPAPTDPAAPTPNATSGLPAPHQNSLGMRFVMVPNAKLGLQMCIHETRVADFRVWVEETNQPPTRFRGMLANSPTGWNDKGGFDWRNPGFPQTDDHPVVGVSWNDAVEYADWLTQRERTKETIRPKQRYRLPTDEEWSRAVGLQPEPGATPRARDGKIKRVYPWGEEWPPQKAYGNYRGPEAIIGQEIDDPKRTFGPPDGYARTAPVMKFPPNALGIYDLGGNVFEWVQDKFDGGRDRTLRGAGWFDFDAERLQSSYRIGMAPTYRQASVGFRLVLVEEP